MTVVVSFHSDVHTFFALRKDGPLCGLHKELRKLDDIVFFRAVHVWSKVAFKVSSHTVGLTLSSS